MFKNTKTFNSLDGPLNMYPVFSNSPSLISSSCENCACSPRKGGIFNDTPGGKSFSISKPLSAITSSPGSNNFKIPQSFVSCLSDVLPAYSSETNVKYPLGAMPSVMVFVV